MSEIPRPAEAYPGCGLGRPLLIWERLGPALAEKVSPHSQGDRPPSRNDLLSGSHSFNAC